MCDGIIVKDRCTFECDSNNCESDKTSEQMRSRSLDWIPIASLLHIKKDKANDILYRMKMKRARKKASNTRHRLIDSRAKCE